MPELAISAPDGSHFEYEEVKTAKGAESLGSVPILIWDKLSAAVAFYGSEDTITDVLDGTSLRVSFQNIARRLKIAGKTDEEIADSMLKFRPGKRVAGATTPASRAARQAKAATEKVGGDSVEKLLAMIAEGKLSEADIQALTA